MPSKTYSQAWAETKAQFQEGRERVQRGESFFWPREWSWIQRWQYLKESGGQYMLIVGLVVPLFFAIDILARHFAPYDETATALMAVSAVMFLPFLTFLAIAVCMKLARRVAHENGHPFASLSYGLLFMFSSMFLVVLAIDAVLNPISRDESRQFWELLSSYFQ